MTLISYAQNGEDILLWRCLSNIQNGFYIDVGANDPIADSVTKLFYDRGWRGINIEPVELCYQSLCSERSEDINLQVCASNHNKTALFYTIVSDNPQSHGLSTLNPELAEEYKVKFQSSAGNSLQCREVNTLTLNQIIKEHALTKDIHFLKIDVEGEEKNCIEGIDLQLYRPWILVIESTAPNSSVQTHTEWEPLLLAANYQFAFFDGLNRYYVAQEHSSLLEQLNYPANILDDFIPYHEFLLKKQNSEFLTNIRHLETQHQQLSSDVTSLNNQLKNAERERKAMEIHYEKIILEHTTQIQLKDNYINTLQTQVHHIHQGLQEIRNIEQNLQRLPLIRIIKLLHKVQRAILNPRLVYRKLCRS